MFTLFGLALIVFGAALILRALRAQAEALRSLTWPSVEGEILTSGFGFIRKYAPAVTYTYRVGSTERRGTQIAIGLNNLYSEWADAEQRAQRYPVGKRVKVYYDPRGTLSVLEAGNTQSANTTLGIGLGLAITGVLLFGIAFTWG